MAKKKDKRGKLPKRVAGIKLPKDLRHKGEALIGAATSPAGREAIARGLTIAATFANVAVRRGRQAHGERETHGDHAPHERREGAKPEPAAQSGEGAAPASSPGPTPAAMPPIDPQKLAEAVSTVADAVLGRLFGGAKHR